ncbi:hypothetical protein [Catenulispora acidiphila]|uniref:hypothetical protein n=1 Tax=Catenulispora acidiphila TaxID=304895 RepID=UPI00117C0D14|nr:hypothetical protein [Catenulispora acidiphila]
MITSTHCRVFDCGWFHRAMASPLSLDVTAEVPPWCTPTWVVAPLGYGSPLTDADVIAAHMATHPAAERSGRMPSREQVEASRAVLIDAANGGGDDV